MADMDEGVQVGVEEHVVLQKFDGEAAPENEVERLVVLNGEVIEHNRIENGEVVGPVEEDNLLGKNIGRLISNEEGGVLS